MLNGVFASKAAKLVAACVCPIAVGTVALKVPPVRSAIHKATAPKPKTEARAKPQAPAPIRRAVAEREEASAPIPTSLVCTRPPLQGDLPPQTAVFSPPDTPMRLDLPASGSVIVNTCGPNRFTLTAATGGAVPEPETWAQMVAGFALMGAILRAGRRRRLPGAA